MNDLVEVREATLTDGPEVMRLLALLGHPQPDGAPVSRFGAFVAEGQHVLVATRSPSRPSERLLGAVTLHITPVLHRAGPIGRLTAVVVDESVRGQGIGRALVEAAEQFLGGRRCAMVELTSNRKRTDAHAFYERLGYTATSFRFAKPLAAADKGDK